MSSIIASAEEDMLALRMRHEDVESGCKGISELFWTLVDGIECCKLLPLTFGSMLSVSPTSMKSNAPCVLLKLATNGANDRLSLPAIPAR